MSNEAAERLRGHEHSLTACSRYLESRHLRIVSQELLDDWVVPRPGALAAAWQQGYQDAWQRLHEPDALAAERRATVERIREQCFDLTKPPSTQPRRWAPDEITLRAILDEEAAR